jgi:hypothetical protein
MSPFGTFNGQKGGHSTGFRSPFAAHARMCEAISAFIADVRFASGNIAVASSSTDFINSISSG